MGNFAAEDGEMRFTSRFTEQSTKSRQTFLFFPIIISKTLFINFVLLLKSAMGYPALVRGCADKSFSRPTSRCRRTESIVSLERGVRSSAELQVFSCYRG